MNTIEQLYIYDLSNQDQYLTENHTTIKNTNCDKTITQSSSWTPIQEHNEHKYKNTISEHATQYGTHTTSPTDVMYIE